MTGISACVCVWVKESGINKHKYISVHLEKEAKEELVEAAQ